MRSNDHPGTVESLLRQAAAADAARASALVSRLSSARLLDLVVTQGQLAVDDTRPRPAGIDAIGELARAAIEVMGLPQDPDLDLDATLPHEPPAVTGWELVTAAPDQLASATLSLPTRPWHLVLVAFIDLHDRGQRWRRLIAAAADGRVATARLRLGTRIDADPDVLEASVSTDPADLGVATSLARALLATLRAAGHGPG